MNKEICLSCEGMGSWKELDFRWEADLQEECERLVMKLPFESFAEPFRHAFQLFQL